MCLIKPPCVKEIYLMHSKFISFSKHFAEYLHTWCVLKCMLFYNFPAFNLKKHAIHNAIIGRHGQNNVVVTITSSDLNQSGPALCGVVHSRLDGYRRQQIKWLDGGDGRSIHSTRTCMNYMITWLHFGSHKVLKPWDVVIILLIRPRGRLTVRLWSSLWYKDNNNRCRGFECYERSRIQGAVEI